MRTLKTWLTAMAFAVALYSAPGFAAESYDNCSGYIDSVPATIATQGTWCLRDDLSTAMTSGNAIEIQTHNVTIDCNGFKLGGLAAGPASGAYGIMATGDRRNVTVRNCTIRGFWIGIVLSGGGALVEDNLLDLNLTRGIEVGGQHNLVQRNHVLDTGCSFCAYSTAIHVTGDAIDNIVSGMASGATNTYPVGIYLDGIGTVARGNRVQGLVVNGEGNAMGIWAGGMAQYFTGQQGIVGNVVTSPVGVTGVGIRGTGVNEAFCSDNHVAGFSILFIGCQMVAGNAQH
jgi:hypothetical protein